MSADAELLSSLDMYTPVIHVDDYVLLPLLTDVRSIGSQKL